MKVIFTTHGTTVESEQGILQGQRPGIITPYGLQQEDELAELLQQEKIDYIDASSLYRCIHMAEKIAKSHPNAIYTKEPRLMARALGVFEGTKKNDAEWAKLSGDYYSNRPDGGETLRETWDRVKNFMYKELFERQNKTTSYIIAHGETKIILEGILKGYSIEEAFRGHDNKGLLPRIAEPAKAEIIRYEFKARQYL